MPYLLQFVQANIAAIMTKLKQLAADKKDEIARAANSGNVGSMSYEQFCGVLQGLAGNQLTDHEVRTIARFYAERKDDKLDLNTLVAIVQDQLRKVNFENFSQLYEHCRHLDQARYEHIVSVKVKFFSFPDVFLSPLMYQF